MEHKNKIDAFVSRVMAMRGEQSLSNSQFMACLEKLIKKRRNIDTGYLLSVLFPEFSAPCRIPTKYTQPTALFTQKYYYNVPASSTGNFVVNFFPLDTVYRGLYIAGTVDDGQTYNGNTANSILTTLAIGASDNRYIPANFSEVRVVGVSIRAQYIGSVQGEQGFIMAANVLDQSPNAISSAIINQGYNVVRARLREGVRMIWLPKDEEQTELWETNYMINASTQDFNNYTVLASSIIGNGDTSSQIVSMKTTSNSTWGVREAGNSTTSDYDYALNYIGQGPKMGSSSQPDQMMMEFWGCPTGASVIRIDVERHLEGIPNYSLRNLVSTQKASPNESALNLIRKMAEVKSVQSHTMEQLPIIQNAIEKTIHDADKWQSSICTWQMDNPDLHMNNSAGIKNLEDLTWLDDIGTGSSTDAGMIGGDSARGRIVQGYEFYQAPQNRLQL